MGSKKSEHCADVICTCRQGYVGLGQRSPTLFIRDSTDGWVICGRFLILFTLSSRLSTLFLVRSFEGPGNPGTRGKGGGGGEEWKEKVDDVDSGENCFWHQSSQVFGSTEWMEIEREERR